MGQVQVKGNWLEYRVGTDDTDMTLEQILKLRLQVSGRRIQKLTRSKGLFVNNKQMFLKKMMKVGDCIRVRMEEGNKQTVVPTKMELEILYEDQWMVVINKPSGIMSYAIKEGTVDTISNGIQYYCNQSGLKTNVHLVHRLDTNTKAR